MQTAASDAPSAAIQTREEDGSSAGDLLSKAREEVAAVPDVADGQATAWDDIARGWWTGPQGIRRSR
jgi:hypothetical protein